MEENKKNSRKVIRRYLILLTFILTIITIYEITNVYAVFHSEATANIGENLAKWEISVNNQDIVSGTEKTFDIGDFTVPDNSVFEGKFAPGLEGYFELTIAPQDTQVSVRYDITIDQSAAVLKNIHLVSVEEVATNNTLVQTAEDTYTGIMPLSDITGNYVNTIRITFKWDEVSDAENAMKNGIDVLSIGIPITVSVKQYLGETITGI